MVWHGMVWCSIVWYKIIIICFLVNYFVRKSKSLWTARRDRPVLAKKMPVLCSGIVLYIFINKLGK